MKRSRWRSSVASESIFTLIFEPSLTTPLGPTVMFPETFEVLPMASLGARTRASTSRALKRASLPSGASVNCLAPTAAGALVGFAAAVVGAGGVVGLAAAVAAGGLVGAEVG